MEGETHKGKLLLVLMAAYFAALYLREQGLGPEWFRFWFTDFIFLPTLLTAVQLASGFVRRPLILTGTHIFVAALYVSVLFEWLLPRFGTAFGGDVADVVCYFAGGLAFGALPRRYRRPSGAYEPKKGTAPHEIDVASKRYKNQEGYILP